MSSRFLDIWYMMTLAGLAIGFVNTLGVWGVEYMSTPDYSSFEIEDIEDMTSAGDLSAWDQFTLFVSQVQAAFGIIGKMAATCIWVYPTMTDVFLAPTAVAAIVQGFVILAWASLIVQAFLRFGFAQVDA